MNLLVEKIMFGKMKGFHEAIERGEKPERPVLHKVFSYEVKGIDLEKRSFDAVASVETEDRSGDIIRVAGWQLKNFAKNPVLMLFHDHNRLPIGSVETINANVLASPPRLDFTPVFASEKANPEAERVFQLFIEGHMRAFSVGFIPLEYKVIRDEEGYITAFDMTTSELLEISAVNVGMHQDALKNRDTGELTSSFEDIAEQLCQEIKSLQDQILELKDSVKSITNHSSIPQTSWSAGGESSSGEEKSLDELVSDLASEMRQIEQGLESREKSNESLEIDLDSIESTEIDLDSVKSTEILLQNLVKAQISKIMDNFLVERREGVIEES